MAPPRGAGARCGVRWAEPVKHPPFRRLYPDPRPPPNPQMCPKLILLLATTIILSLLPTNLCFFPSPKISRPGASWGSGVIASSLAPRATAAALDNQLQLHAALSAPAVLERPTVLGKPIAVISPKVKKNSKLTKAKGWELRIYNDSLNTREHVARCLVQITGKSEMDAYNLMMNAHKNGVAVVGVWMFEQAEAFCDQLVQTGLIADISPLD